MISFMIVESSSEWRPSTARSRLVEKRRRVASLGGCPDKHRLCKGHALMRGRRLRKGECLKTTRSGSSTPPPARFARWPEMATWGMEGTADRRGGRNSIDRTVSRSHATDRSGSGTRTITACAWLLPGAEIRSTSSSGVRPTCGPASNPGIGSPRDDSEPSQCTIDADRPGLDASVTVT